MNDSGKSRILSGTAWGILVKIIDASFKFLAVPLLVSFYGKADYGLVALTFSLNAYLRLMDMGMNTGSIRFFAIWAAEGQHDKLIKASQSSIVFYGVIGIINTVLFLCIGFFGSDFFKLEEGQSDIFRWMMIILAASSILNWTSNVVSQLLTAVGQYSFVSRATLLSSSLAMGAAFAAVHFKLELSTYFFLYIAANLSNIPLIVLKLKVFNIPYIQLLKPRWNPSISKEILRYSMAIMIMGIFQFTADNLRPLLLGRFASNGIESLTDYRIIQTIIALVMAFGAVFRQTILPVASKLYINNEQAKIYSLIFDGTRYISFFFSFFIFLIIANSQQILNLFMGDEYENLALWLIIWLATALLTLHKYPVDSLILSSGKTRFLIYSSAVSCIISLPITGFFAYQYNVGAAVIGYFVYIVIQIAGYYFYYIPRVLKLNSYRLFFSSFAPSACLGLVCCVISYAINSQFNHSSPLWSITVNSIVFSVIYLLCGSVVIVKIDELKTVIFNRKFK